MVSYVLSLTDLENNWMQKFSLRTQLISLLLVPIGLMIIALAIFFSYEKIDDLQQSLQQRGYSLMSQLTPASKFALYVNNPKMLQDLANAAIENPDISAIAIYDAQGHIEAYAGPDKLLVSKINPSDTRTKILPKNHFLQFVTPIISQSPTDTLTPNLKNAANTPMGWLVFDMDQTATTIQQYQTIAINSMFALFAICLMLFFYLNFEKKFIMPFFSILKTTRRIADGKISERTISPQQLELNQLSRHINVVTQEYEQVKQNIEQQVAEVTSDLEHSLSILIDENSELELARKEAIESARIKSEFIASISHEIRAPMNGIIGFANLLDDTDLQPHQREYLQTIQRSGNNLLAVINNLLDYSKIEAGRLELDYVPMDIRDTLDDVVQILAPMAHDKKIELIDDVDPNIPIKLIGDPLRIKQILTNLISNAIKFTEHGHIYIHSTIVGTVDNKITLKITVTDTGIGIPVPQQKQLFQAFSQVHKTPNKMMGTGLGLVISKKLTHLMGGDIGVNPKYRDGSEFWFTFICDKIADHAHAFSYNRLNQVKILLWDANTFAQKALVSTMKLWNLDIAEVDSMQSVLHYLENNQIDVLLLGNNSTQDASQFINEVLNPIVKKYKLEIVVLVNTNEQKHISLLMAHGASVCLTKPVNARKLYNELCKLMLENPTNMHIPQAIKIEEPTPSFEKAKLALIIDDDLACRFLLQSLLEQQGYQVVTAENGHKALTICEKQHFDIIFVDMQMPGIDGITTIKRLQQIKHCKKTPVILLSAAEMQQYQDNLKSIKVNRVLTKPITLDVLKDILEQSKSATLVKKGRKACIDWEQATQLTGGNLKLAKELLTMFMDSLTDELASIEALYQEKNYATLADVAHRLHGGVSYCGLPSLKQAIKVFETALKSGKYEDIEKAYKKFNKEVQRLQKEYTQVTE